MNLNFSSSICSLCGEKDPLGGLGATDELMMSMRGKKLDWVFEYKPGSSGGKIYSHTMCIPCHRYELIELYFKVHILYIKKNSPLFTTSHMCKLFSECGKNLNTARNVIYVLVAKILATEAKVFLMPSPLR